MPDIATNLVVCGNVLELLAAMPDASVDLVLGSPPYAEKGQRYKGAAKPIATRDWVDWMLKVTREAVRVSRNVVVWVVNGSVRDGCYLPACEGLAWRAWSEFGIRCERPAIWHKNSAPTNRPWFGNDWEFCQAYRPSVSTEYFDWESIASPPKFASGGKFRQRDANGVRRVGNEYPQGTLARPRDVIRATVGGGHLGSDLAHECEAPFPEKLVEPFVRACCPANGIVLDPFCGSGTTLAVAEMNGRQWIGFDVRESMRELSIRRVAEAKERTEKMGTNAQ